MNPWIHDIFYEKKEIAYDEIKNTVYGKKWAMDIAMPCVVASIVFVEMTVFQQQEFPS